MEAVASLIVYEHTGGMGNGFLIFRSSRSDVLINRLCWVIIGGRRQNGLRPFHDARSGAVADIHSRARDVGVGGAALRSSTGLLAGTPSSYLSTPTFPGIETIGDE